MTPNKPYIIGLTGGIASGKSTASAHLAKHGFAIVDADAISRAVTGPGGEGLAPIRQRFGEECFTRQDRLDRGALGAIIFADPAARKDLEGILHPIILRKMQKETATAFESGHTIIIWDVPLLFESGMDALCDETWLIDLPEDVQIERLMRRDGLTREQALLRIDSQMPLAQKRQRASRWIRNHGDTDELAAQIDALAGVLRSLYI